MQLSDQSQRSAFAEEIWRNFSVIASAGAGKTTAITERIANFINWDAKESSDENTQCGRLVAVTYTEKAAAEIRDRVSTIIFAKTENSSHMRGLCLARMEYVFFGTIHALAAKFLRTHCMKVGIRGDFEIAEDENRLWSEFLKHFGDPLNVIPESVRNDFLCTHSIDDLMASAIGRISCAEAADCRGITNVPEIDVGNILAHAAKGNELKIKQFLQLLAEWESFRNRGEYFPMPDFLEICSSQNFIQFCQQELKDFIAWKRRSEEFFMAKVAEAYKGFRVDTGKLLYDDLINLALVLLENRDVIAEIEAMPYAVILDEAQDTDGQQFRFLLGISQKVLGEGICMDTLKNFPEDGYFSMVGDPQQSIYCDRADVKVYTKLHESLVRHSAAAELTFAVTMRCPSEIVDFVNYKFSGVFADINFVPLEARPNNCGGGISIFKLKKCDGDKVTCAAKQVAELFIGKAAAAFGVNSWSDVAILAPRKDWLLDISKCFSGDGKFPQVQLHFDAMTPNAPSPIRWLASCLRYINNPVDDREFAGILREIFGFKSTEIIDYFKYKGSQQCAAVDVAFSQIRKKRHSGPLAKFLLLILDEVKIFQRIDAIGIFSKEDFALKRKQAVELCYFAEVCGMNPVEAENFFTEKIESPIESEKINQSAVQFLTFHKSKGLEWQVVILPFMYRGRKLFGTSAQRKLLTGEQFSKFSNNECRLLYVACTRAKKRLIILDDSEIFGTKLDDSMISSAGSMEILATDR